MLILGLLGMYFDAVVAEVKTFLLLFRYALAILCNSSSMLFLFELFGALYIYISGHRAELGPAQYGHSKSE